MTLHNFEPKKRGDSTYSFDGLSFSMRLGCGYNNVSNYDVKNYLPQLKKNLTLQSFKIKNSNLNLKGY